MKIFIRLADVQDIDSIVPLLGKLHEHAGFSKCAEFDPESARDFTRKMIDAPNGRVIVALDGDNIIGLSTFVVDSPYFNFSKKVASGISFWVESEYRKLGVGKALYNVSETTAKALGCSFITVGVMIGDEHLESYHERNGFVRHETLFHKVI